MEFLQREVNQLVENGNFNFHPRCRKRGTIRICFADDLHMFCTTDIESIKLLQGSFQRFSIASGLLANTDKTSIYMARVYADERQTILPLPGFEEGTLPFRYLWVLMSSKKLPIHQCVPLIEKITVRINCWSTKLLSYSSRLQLIKSVLFGIHTY